MWGAGDFPVGRDSSTGSELTSDYVCDCGFDPDQSQ